MARRGANLSAPPHRYLTYLGANGVDILKESAASDAQTFSACSLLRAYIANPEAVPADVIKGQFQRLQTELMSHMAKVRHA